MTCKPDLIKNTIPLVKYRYQSEADMYVSCVSSAHYKLNQYPSCFVVSKSNTAVVTKAIHAVAFLVLSPLQLSPIIPETL